MVRCKKPHWDEWIWSDWYPASFDPPRGHGYEFESYPLYAHPPTSAEPAAWLVHVAAHDKSYAVLDKDDADLVDDCTNHDAVVTPLYPPTSAAMLDAALAAKERP